MASFRGRNRKLMISAGTKESALSGGAAVDSLIRVSSAPGNLKIEYTDDRDLVGGLEGITEQEEDVRRYDVPFAQSQVKPHTLAFALAAGLGTVSSTTPPGASTARLHAITQKAAKDHTTFSVEELLISGVQRKYNGVFLDSFGLSGARRQFMALTGQLFGSGHYVAGTANESEQAEPSLHMRNMRLWLSAGAYDGNAPTQSPSQNNLGGSPVAINVGTEQIDYQYQNNTDLDFLYPPGGGVTMGRAERNERTHTLTQTILFQNENDFDRFEANTTISMQMKNISTVKIGADDVYFGFSLVWPKVGYRVHDVQGGAGDRMTAAITFSIMEDATYGEVRGWVWNAFTTYLA